MPEFEFTTVNFGRFAVLLLAVSLHESAHAFVATWCGDRTAKERGRVTLNPLKHLDPVMSVILPAFLLFSSLPYVFGAGKPVPVVKENLRKPARDFALIAIAGPLTNVLLALVFTGLFVKFGRAGGADLTSEVLRFGMRINILLAIFNMIPIPPLDGSRFVAYLLPGPLQQLWYRLDLIGFLILIVLLVTGVIQKILEKTYAPAWAWWNTKCGEWM